MQQLEKIHKSWIVMTMEYYGMVFPLGYKLTLECVLINQHNAIQTFQVDNREWGHPLKTN